VPALRLSHPTLPDDRTSKLKKKPVAVVQRRACESFSERA
jgi:hypothetical protein